MHILQSEMGATGECSPNLDLVNEVAVKLDKFEHVHDTLSDGDCYLFITHALIGTRIGEATPGFLLGCNFKGCEIDLVRMLADFLMAHPDMITIFKSALVSAVLNLELRKQKPNNDAERN